MLGSAQPMIEAMLHEFHNPQEAARLRPYFSGHRRDLPAEGGSVGYEERRPLVERLFSAAVDRVRSLTPGSRPAASSC